jgi:hypothetical protein
MPPGIGTNADVDAGRPLLRAGRGDVYDRGKYQTGSTIKQMSGQPVSGEHAVHLRRRWFVVA